MDFGIGRNLSAMISHRDRALLQRRRVDITFMGAGEDPHGTSMPRLGASCPARAVYRYHQNARHVVFCSSLPPKG